MSEMSLSQQTFIAVMKHATAMSEQCSKPGASTSYKRWSKCTMDKVGGSVFAET